MSASWLNQVGAVELLTANRSGAASIAHQEERTILVHRTNQNFKCQIRRILAAIQRFCLRIG